jgi:hypothetical protein
VSQPTVSGGQSPADVSPPWQKALDFGLGAAAAIFLYWNFQSGFFGALSVGLPEAGLDAAAPAQLAVGLGYVGAMFAVLTIAPILIVLLVALGWQLFRSIWRARRRVRRAHGRLAPFAFRVTRVLVGRVTRWYLTHAVLLIGLTLIVGLVLQAIVDRRFTNRTWHPMLGVVLTAAMVTLGRHLGGRNRAEILAGRWATAVLAIVVLGYTVNAWSYNLGLSFRTLRPSHATFLIGRTPPEADVTWLDAKTVPHGFAAGVVYHLFELGHHDGKYVLYDRRGGPGRDADRTYSVSEETVTVVDHPVDRPQ